MQFIDLKSQQARIRDDIDRRIAAVLDHGQYILGPEVRELEEGLQDYVGSRHCITVASGTDSLLIAMMALGIGPVRRGNHRSLHLDFHGGDDRAGGREAGILSMCRKIPGTWIRRNSKRAITERTGAIMPVGIYGQTADMTAINEIAVCHGNLPVIEDAAQSFGATHHGGKSCALSGIGSTSFFPSKPLGCYGDGGALFTDDDDLADKMRQIRVHGQAKKHHHPILGINGRFDSIQAAVVLAKLQIFDEEIQRRQQVAARYAEALADSQSIQAPKIGQGNTSVYAQYTVLSENRDELQARLTKAEIPSVAYYAVPLHLQPVFADLGHAAGDFPVTEKVSEQCLSLPMSPYLSDEEIDQVVSALAFAKS